MKSAREMSITHREFLRLLPHALEGRAYRHENNTVVVNDDSRTIKIALSPESMRKIASLTLPVTEIRIELENFSVDEQAAFLKKFDRTFQRGGG